MSPKERARSNLAAFVRSLDDIKEIREELGELWERPLLDYRGASPETRLKAKTIGALQRQYEDAFAEPTPAASPPPPKHVLRPFDSCRAMPSVVIADGSMSWPSVKACAAHLECARTNVLNALNGGALCCGLTLKRGPVIPCEQAWQWEMPKLKPAGYVKRVMGKARAEAEREGVGRSALYMRATRARLRAKGELHPNRPPSPPGLGPEPRQAIPGTQPGGVQGGDARPTAARAEGKAA